jgi:hypothetical protein
MAFFWVETRQIPTFRRNILSPSSGLKYSICPPENGYVEVEMKMFPRNTGI